MVKAEAADFSDNDVYGLSDPVVINSEYLILGKAKILKYDSNSRQYIVVAKDGDSVTVSELENTMLVIFKKNAVESNSYYRSELADNIVDPALYTVASSNKRVLSVAESSSSYYVDAIGIGKGIKLTATTKDGGKAKSELKININYDVPAYLGIMAETYVPNKTGSSSYEEKFSLLKDASTGEEAEMDCNNLTFSGNQNTNIRVTVKSNSDANGIEWEALDGLINYSLTIKGGTIVNKNVADGIYEIYVKDSKATVTLAYTDSANTKKKQEYNITNTAFDGYKALAAPAVKVGGTLKCLTPVKQTARYVISHTKYNLDGKYILVETDYTNAVKNPSGYADIRKSCSVIDSSVPVPVKSAVDSKGKTFYYIELDYQGVEIPVYSYKLVFTPGEVSGGIFIPSCKNSAVTQSFAKPKVVKGSFTPQKAVKFKEADINSGAKIELSGTGTVIKSFEYSEILDCNVAGKSNGFTDYFELTYSDPDENGNRKYYISLKDEVKNNPQRLAYIKTKAGNDARYGYIRYSAKCGDDGYGNPYTYEGTVKITITIAK